MQLALDQLVKKEQKTALEEKTGQEASFLTWHSSGAKDDWVA